MGLVGKWGHIPKHSFIVERVVKSKHSSFLLCILALVLSLSGCANRSIEVNANLGKEFTLSIGQSATIAGENLRIRFAEVLEDSRCPRDVICIWAGRVSCIVELTYAGSSYRMALTEPGLTDEYSKERYEGYEITFHVIPYPEAGEKISRDTYRLQLIVSRLAQLTERVGSVIADPYSFEGQNITVVGYYRGWDLLHEANTSPPVTRSDWVIKDSTGAIYVSADSEAKVPEGLRPDLLEDTGVILEIKGVVHVTEGGQPYIEATSIECIS